MAKQVAGNGRFRAAWSSATHHVEPSYNVQRWFVHELRAFLAPLC